MVEMLTVSKVLSDAKTLGIRLSPRSFWSYCEQGLLPKGKKLSGYGNCSYFPADTLSRLYVLLLFKHLRVPHSFLVEACSNFVSEASALRRESLPPISQSKRRVTEEYKRALLDIVKRAINISVEVLPPITTSSNTVKTLVEVKGRKFRDEPEGAPEVTPEVTPEKPTQSGLKKGKQSGRAATKA
jgi:hypothetical protein